MTLKQEPAEAAMFHFLLGKELALSLNYICIGFPLLQKFFFVLRMENSLAIFFF